MQRSLVSLIFSLGMISPILANGIELMPDRVDTIDEFADESYAGFRHYLYRHILLDGNWAVLRHGSVDGSLLRVVSREGAPSWSKRSNQSSTFELRGMCGTEQVCVATRTATLAIDLTTGQVRAQLPPSTHVSPTRDGGLALLQAHPAGGFGGYTAYQYERILIAADGQIRADRIEAEPEGSTTPVAIAADGTVFSADENWFSLVVTDPSGDSRPLLTPGPDHCTAYTSFLGLARIPSAIADPEGVFALGHDCTHEHTECSSALLRRVEDDGIRWQMPIPLAALPPHASGWVDWEMQPVADGGVILAISHAETYYSSMADNDFLLLKVSADGDRLWQRHWRNGRHGASRLFQVPETDAVVLVRPSSHRPALSITVLDADSGRLRSESWLACPDLDCDRWSFDVAPTGAMVALGSSRDGARLLWLDQVAAAITPGVELDQDGLDGAWYSPLTAGQGFNLRRLPGDETSTLFMPWFTHGHLPPDQVGQDGQLRWFTLQASIPTGARELTLPIRRMSDGRFLEPAEGSQEVVGDAHLRFPDCQTALLDYHFDDDDEASRDGTLVLQRLLPLTSDCVEADGSTTAATFAVDQAVSGTWYDPAVPGQGLDIHRATRSDQGNGLLFGTWHTFVPASVEDPTDARHWFTLELPDATGDGVRGRIVLTRDGRFDSANAVQHLLVGDVDLQSVRCDRLDLHYRFDDHPRAGPFQALQGRIELYRLGECQEATR